LQVGKFPAEFSWKNSRMYFSGKITWKFSDNLWYKNVTKHSKKCAQYHLHKIKEELNNGRSHYGQWTWSLDTTWKDDELTMDWLMDDCFLLFCLLTYFMQSEFSGKIPENFPHSIFPEKLQPYSQQHVNEAGEKTNIVYSSDKCSSFWYKRNLYQKLVRGRHTLKNLAQVSGGTEWSCIKMLIIIIIIIINTTIFIVLSS